MKARSLGSRILTVLGAMLMLTLSAALAWAVTADYQQRGLVPPGVTIAGKDMSGYTEAQVRVAIEDAVSTPMMQPVTVSSEKKTWTLDPKEFVSIDVEAMLNDAYSTRRSAALVARLDSNLRGTPLSHEVKPQYSIDTTAIAAWVKQSASEVNRKPKDATRQVVDYAFKFTPAVYGVRVDQVKSAKSIANALSADAALSDPGRTVVLTVKSIKPKVTDSSFKTAIIVSLPDCRIYLYKGTKVVKTYRCAPGRPGFSTPTGDFFIQSKQRYASWINPGSAWAKSMPRVIPGGPNNPMGTTKIGINWSGVFFHGIPPSEYSSIGTHASHGCMRMMPSDVLDLYGRVNINDPVFIRP